MEDNVKKIVDLILDKETNFKMSVHTVVDNEFDISPHDFLEYAETDLASNYDHNIINALSNAKRALDCQLDYLLISFGFYKISQKKNWGFPKKLEIIQSIGLIAPRILKKINKQRNLLEHQFIKPTNEQVEDMLDIAMLFIASTDYYIFKFVSDIAYENKKLKTKILINLDYKASKIRVYQYDNETNKYANTISDSEKEGIKPKSTIEWEQGSSDYLAFLNIYIELIK